MELRRLKYFLAIAEEGSITKAALRLGMSQPPLSQQLKILESELGVALVDRSDPKGIRLTEAGRALNSRARQILALVDDSVEEVRECAYGDRGTLAIAISTTRGSYVADLVAAFARARPDVNFQIWYGDVGRVEELLDKGAVAMAVTRPPSDIEAHDFLLLRDEPMVAAIPSSWELGKTKEGLGLDELASVPLIVHRRHEKLLEHYRRVGIVPRIICMHNDVYSMLCLADAGLGAAIVHESAQKHFRGRDLVFRRIDDASLRANPIALVWMRKWMMSSLAVDFLDAVRSTEAEG